MRKKNIADYFFFLLLFILFSVVSGMYIYKSFFQPSKEKTEKSIQELNKKVISSTTKNRILLAYCNDKNVKPLIEVLSRYGKVYISKKVTVNDINNYNIIVLYSCPFTESEDVILSNINRLNIKWIGIFDIGDPLFREKAFDVVDTTDLKYLSLERDSYLINRDVPIITFETSKDRIRPSFVSIGYYEKSQCNGILASILNPFDPANSDADSSVGICFEENRLYFGFDINEALKEGQAKQTIIDALDSFINH
jgi:hypothetical protein